MLNLQVSVGLVILHDWDLADESLGSDAEEIDCEAGDDIVRIQK
jgi:hypothetical protein